MNIENDKSKLKLKVVELEDSIAKIEYDLQQKKEYLQNTLDKLKQAEKTPHSFIENMEWMESINEKFQKQFNL